MSAFGPRIFISAGEVSGDIVAAKLIRELRATTPSAIVDGVGGSRMADAGATLVAAANHIGAVGVSEGLAVAPSAIRVFRSVTAHLRRHRPDAAVLIANDVFNVLLGRWLRRRGIPTISFFPPQTWIWGILAPLFARSFDVVLASFPDEERCYARTGVATTFVGHYLANVLSVVTPEQRIEARRALGLSPLAPVAAILPGSRALEINRLLPVLLDAADQVRDAVPAVEFVAALSPHSSAGTGEALRSPLGQRISISDNSHMVMRAADVILSCSGTATLEAALIGVPMVSAYTASRTTYAIVRACIRIGLMPGDTIALPNLVLGRRVVPEFIQGQVKAPDIARAASAILLQRARQHEIQRALQDVRERVERPATIANVARIVLERARA
jgi:lipid-A-disaccharide synthase